MSNASFSAPNAALVGREIKSNQVKFIKAEGLRWSLTLPQ